MSGPVLAGVSFRLIEFCQRNGLFITCGKNGEHNEGSKHYAGHAVDFRSRGLSADFVKHLERDAAACGFHLRDERKRPKGQKVWGGAHFHLEIP